VIDRVDTGWYTTGLEPIPKPRTEEFAADYKLGHCVR
jgi:hypothetical protein